MVLKFKLTHPAKSRKMLVTGAMVRMGDVRPPPPFTAAGNFKRLSTIFPLPHPNRNEELSLGTPCAAVDPSCS